MRSSITIVGLIGLGLLFSGCGGNGDLSFGDQTAVEAAIELIESDAMAQRLGLDPLTSATCAEPEQQRVGTTFPCEALVETDGSNVRFEVLLEGDEQLFAGPRNVVDGRDLAGFERDVVRSLNRDNGFEFPDDALDCGNRSVVLDADQQMACTLTDPATDSRFDAAVSVIDIDVLSFTVEITGEAS